MSRLKPTTIATFLVYAVMLAAVILLFVVQQQRITSDEANYNHLFAQYTNSVQDCARANDCTSTVPAPSVIKGAAGQNGANGRDATDDQVFSAVSNYCALRGDCEGPEGPPSTTPGPSGTNGADSTVPGPAGPQGDQGAPGADGRGISNVSCVMEPDLTTALRFTFTDSTTEDVAASCIPTS